MPSKSLLPYGFKSQAESLAIKFRTELGISKFDPLDAFKLAGHLNVAVFTVDETFETAPDHPHRNVLNNTEKFDAMWMANHIGDKIIIHNSKHSGFRQQSNLMHELAHIIRCHEIPDHIKQLPLPLDLHYYNPLHEQEAKYLGGCLQITKPGLLWAIKRYNEDQISKYYNASIEMVRYRLQITGIAKQKGFYNT